MQQTTPSERGHKKLKIFFGLVASLFIGFLVYKYAYIFLERQRYEKAEAAIMQVADDLRRQGLETTKFKNCERAQVKFGNGFTSCHVGIIYEGEEDSTGIKESLDRVIASIEKNGFEYAGGGGLSATRHPIVVGDSSYTLQDSVLGCSLSYDKVDDFSPPYTLTLSCGESSRFAIYTET